MEWSEEEMTLTQQEAERVVGEPVPAEDQYLMRKMLGAVMRSAVELVAARRELVAVEQTLAPVFRAFPWARDVVSTLGARIAVLEDERKRWTKHRNELAEQRNNARQEGTESMRAECLKIVAEEMGLDGWANSAPHRRIKERIEGAAP